VFKVGFQFRVCFGLRVFVVMTLGKTGGAMVKEAMLDSSEQDLG
jgi:hypothetical protein